MKRPSLIIGFMVTLIICLTVVQVMVSNMLSTTGIDLSKIQDEVAAYQKENTLLEEKILAASSLTHIAEVAGKLGYEEPNSQVSIASPLPLALKQ